MAGLGGPTQTFRLTDNKRVAKFSVLSRDATNSTNTRWFAKLPSASPYYTTPVAGVTLEHYLEPNTFYAEDTDPTTITGGAPGGGYTLGGTGIALDRGITLSTNGAFGVRCYVGGTSAINAGDIILVVDQYGRVDSLKNIAPGASTLVYPVGISSSQTASGTVTNQVIFVDLNFAPYLTKGGGS